MRTVALIGCGRMGAHTNPDLKNRLPAGWIPLNHLDAICSLRQLRLIALCDTNQTALEQASAVSGVKNLYSDYQIMLSQHRPDIVSVATRTEGRTAIMKSAIEHGAKGLHVEKPISRSVADCNNILELAQNSNVKISYGTYRRYMAIYREAKKILDSGEIGAIIEIRIEYGKTFLMWTHPHAADLMIYFSSAPSFEYVQSDCTIDENMVSDDFVDADPVVNFAYIKFSNGINGLITSGNGLNTIISCEKGTVEIKADGSKLILRKKNNSPLFLDESTLSPDITYSGTQQAFVDLLHAVETRCDAGISYQDILLSQKILTAIAQSSLQNGCRIFEHNINSDLVITGRTGNLYA